MVVSFAIGLGWNRLVKGDTWKYVLGALVAHPRTRGWIWQGAKWGAPFAWTATRVVAADVALIGRAALGTTTVTTAAAVGAGYTIGAVTGTVIISQAEEKGIVYEGATSDVIDFYTGEGQYWAQGADDPTPGYFNIPGNASLIAKHYWNKWT